MGNSIFGAANRVEVYAFDGTTVGALAVTLTQIIESDIQRNGDLSWNLSFVQDQDDGTLGTYVEDNVNADSDGGGNANNRKYQDGTDAASPSSSGSSGDTLGFLVAYGGVNEADERKIWAGPVRLLASSGGYKEAHQQATDVKLDYQSVKSGADVQIASAGDIVPEATLVGGAADVTVTSGSYGQPFHVPNA